MSYLINTSGIAGGVLQSQIKAPAQLFKARQSGPSHYVQYSQNNNYKRDQNKYLLSQRNNVLDPSHASASIPSSSPAQQPAPSGIKMVPALITMGVWAFFKFIVPCPAEISMQGWNLLSVFLATVVSLVLEPLPIGACTLIAATACIASGTLPFASALAALHSEVIWLIVISFFFAKGFESTGLGKRVATWFVYQFGKSTLGLSYGLCIAEAIIAPALPSTSARAGGIFNPIIRSLSKAAGSEPNSPSAAKFGTYLHMSQLQTSAYSSSLFLTAAAQNLLCIQLAQSMNIVIPFVWTTWLVGACVPTVALIALAPYIVYKLDPPEIKETPEAPKQAKKDLQAMGPLSKNEKIMSVTMVGAVALWMFGDLIGVSSVTTALLGLVVLLLTGVLSWKDCLQHSSAWDTLVWFSIMVSLSGQLNEFGVIRFVSKHASSAMMNIPLTWPFLLGLLNIAYFVVHYLFASQTAHVSALYGAFLALMVTCGVPPMVGALSLAYTSNLFGGITHYSSGQAAVYAGGGYMKVPDMFRMGLIMSIVTGLVWLVLGMPWWVAIGWIK